MGMARMVNKILHSITKIGINVALISKLATSINHTKIAHSHDQLHSTLVSNLRQIVSIPYQNVS